MPNSSFAPAEQRGDFSLQLRPTPAAVSDLTLQPATRQAPTMLESLARAVAQLEALVQAADAYLISGGDPVESNDLCRELDRSRGALAEVLGALS